MERKLLVSDLTVGYEGLFSSEDLFKLIEDWFQQNGYQKNEIKHIERVAEKGKFIDLEVMPFKELNEYSRYEIYVKVKIRDLVETKVKKTKGDFKINKGKIMIVMDVFLATDIKHRMESRPFYFFIRTIMDKFIHREYTNQLEKGLMKDVNNFHTELKAYLNLERFKEQA